jgi:Dual-action HEIGH metallo-peptidase
LAGLDNLIIPINLFLYFHFKPTQTKHMKKLLSLTVLLSLLFVAIHSCKKQDQPNTKVEISQDILAQIRNLGFSDENVMHDEGGYVVEGDIFLPFDLMSQKREWTTLTIANTEQYRTNNLVTSLPRTITVSVSNKLPSSYVSATDVALTRFNSENLRITFQRVSRRADISLNKAPVFAQYLASAGFPTSSGQPHNNVKINSAFLGNNPNQSYLATIIAHELGHCIGFRHTDFMNRSFSCNGSAVNEGDGGVGAIHIPGTPTGPDPNSWMLSCIGSGQNRPFNNNDKTALAFLY